MESTTVQCKLRDPRAQAVNNAMNNAMNNAINISAQKDQAHADNKTGTSILAKSLDSL